MDKVQNVRRATQCAPLPAFCHKTDNRVRLSAFDPVSEADVNKHIQQVPDKQSWLDPMSTWLLKGCSDLLSPFVTSLINASLSSGRFLTAFKRAVITPLHKQPGMDINAPQNYRPISNLSVLSKLTERVVSTQLQTYGDMHDLLPHHQSAYRPGHSTETALVKVYSDLVQGRDSGNVAVLALLDMTAAFDSVDHVILLERLRCTFGISDMALAWFSTYLCGRAQSIRL